MEYMYTHHFLTQSFLLSPEVWALSASLCVVVLTMNASGGCVLGFYFTNKVICFATFITRGVAFCRATTNVSEEMHIHSNDGLLAGFSSSLFVFVRLIFTLFVASSFQQHTFEVKLWVAKCN